MIFIGKTLWSQLLKAVTKTNWEHILNSCILYAHPLCTRHLKSFIIHAWSLCCYLDVSAACDPRGPFSRCSYVKKKHLVVALASETSHFLNQLVLGESRQMQTASVASLFWMWAKPRNVTGVTCLTPKKKSHVRPASENATKQTNDSHTT